MLLNALYPPRCAACDFGLPSRTPFCDPCRESLWPIDVACPLCALPIEGTAWIACRRCGTRPPPLAAAASPFRFGGELAVAIRRLKFDGRGDLARQLAPLFAEPIARLTADCDLVVPVPLHWRRELSRGFNQARLLAKFALNGPERRKLAGGLLRRRRRTAEQSGLSAAERAVNVRGAFVVPPRRRHQLRGARVLLFDDVITTGATMFAAAAALKSAGALAVVGFALARAA